MMERILAPSILSADFKVLGEQMELCEKSGAKYLHFDVMDGMFVKNLSFGIPVLASIQGHTGLVMDVHLMIEEPIRYAEAFANAGADILTVHYEACENLQETVDKIHACGMKAGITIKPDTPVDVLVPYLDQAERGTGKRRTEIYPGVAGEDPDTARASGRARTAYRYRSRRRDRSRQRENGSGCRSQCDRSGIRRI